MSVCLEHSNVLANLVGTCSSTTSSSEDAPPITSSITQLNTEQASSEAVSNPLNTKNIAKLVVANHTTAAGCNISGNTILQKVVNPPLITVLNSSGPLTVVKTLCVTSGVSSTPQFTVVNSAPLNVTNSVIGKPPTITLLNGPVTVVKAISTTADKSLVQSSPPESVQTSSTSINAGLSSVSSIIENRGHNVFVKNTCSEQQQDIPQSHKLLTANNFPQNNILNVSQPPSKINGQRNKLKIVSNIMPSTSQNANNNLLLNKTNTTQRYVPRPKMIGPNGTTTKYLNKPPLNNIMKSNMIKTDKSPQRLVYPTHKSQIKTLPPVNNYMHKSQGIKTLPPHPSPSMPSQMQRTGSGLRTLPPQRPPKIANKPNYIGKHAVQAQKMKHTHGKIKGIKPSNPPYNSYHIPPMPEKQLTFNQALTAEILETLGNKNGTPSSSYSYKNYEIMPSRYENAYCYENKPVMINDHHTPKAVEDKTKSGLDALSLICQAVLLDHNYNATLPPDSPTKPTPPTPQVNGLSGNSMYSPGTKRRSLSSSQTTSATSSLSSMSVLPNSVVTNPQEDDAASDISYGSDRKHDTEGEETDTAPEAEAVNNEQMDHYGDYVTRCICGFLHDDGYMIECDMCKVWQHVQCVIKNKQVPDEYLCEECDPTKPVERQKARMAQQQWLRDRHFPDLRKGKDPKVKEMLKLKVRETISDSDSSDGEHAPHNNNMILKGRSSLSNRRKSDPQKHTPRQRRDSVKDVGPRKQVKRRERKIVKRKPKQQVKSHSDEEHQDSFSGTHLPQLRQWIENYEEAVTNHYSPELRARISSIRVNGAHSDLQIQLDSSVHKCRVHTQPLTELKYLVSTVHLPPNTPVVELRGKYMLSTQHRNSGGALTTRQHAQRPGPFLFFYRLHKDNTEVCVDTRTYGNSARFIRRSCKPNAELRHCIEKGVLHLYIVSIAVVDKNMELTIKHESHDLAAIGTTLISCACGCPDNCTVNKAATIKKNGETPEVHRKRRGRRTTSVTAFPSCEAATEVSVRVKEDPELPEVPPAVSPPPIPALVKEERPPSPPVPEKKDESFKLNIKEQQEEEIILPVVKKEEEDIKVEENLEPHIEEKKIVDEIKDEKEETKLNQNQSCITTRRSSSHHKSTDKEDKELPSTPTKEGKSLQGSKKLSREERKLEAILRAIEQMEKAEQRKQEHQGKQAHRRESEPGPNIKEEDKSEPKVKRRRRKGRSRTTSTNTQSTRRNRLNSTDSYLTSGDESLLSPSDSAPPNRPNTKELCSADNNKDNMLLMLSGEKLEKSPTREDSNSNSAHSSPETPLSSACLLVQAAVEPLEPGFKFPKKVLMNEWLNKVPEPIHSASSISPSSLTPHVSSAGTDYEAAPNFYMPGKNLNALAQAASFCDNTSNNQTHGSAKKRWLRQAISEDQCDSPTNRPESPSISEMAAPPKKRRLPRESLSNDASPPSTPNGSVPQIPVSSFPIQEEISTNAPFHVVSETKSIESEKQEGCVEIVYSGTEGDSPSQTLESDSILKERAEEMKQEFSTCLLAPVQDNALQAVSALTCLMDPRLSRDHNHQMFSNSEHLVGTVEKTLSILGFDDRKPDPVTPIKRKLSITEYRQRKKLSNDCNDKSPEEPMSTEENTSESFKPCRPRSNSSSSSSSITSTDDDITLNELPGKVPAFNSEPTELERQREISSLRLKKAFGLAVDDESRKPTLDVEAILSCELPPVVKPSIPLSSPTFPIPGSLISGSVSCSPKPLLLLRESEISATITPIVPSSEPDKIEPKVQETNENFESDSATTNEPITQVDDKAPVLPKEDEMELPPTPVQDELEDDHVEVQPKEERKAESNMFYTPDEDENHETLKPEVETLNYVPPFNNPVYANTGFSTAYSSAIDDEARYEGRNPSPPPEIKQT